MLKINLKYSQLVYQQLERPRNISVLFNIPHFDLFAYDLPKNIKEYELTEALILYLGRRINEILNINICVFDFLPASMRSKPFYILLS